MAEVMAGERCSVRRAAKYLGIVIGPDSEEHFWQEAVAKFSSRVRQIVSIGSAGGDMFAMYRIYALSTLSYIAQLGEPGTLLRQREQAAIARLLRAPMHSLGPGAVTNLRLLGGRT